jgi:hypothetical protein
VDARGRPDLGAGALGRGTDDSIFPSRFSFGGRSAAKEQTPAVASEFVGLIFRANSSNAYQQMANLVLARIESDYLGDSGDYSAGSARKALDEHDHVNC